jgi:glycosyltransferase involved in cell wall biosynthesis
VVVAIYDDPIAQARSLGVTLDLAWESTLRRRQVANRDAFRWLVVPTASFAELAELPLDRVIVGGNGTDTTMVRPGPWPDVPTIGMVSGAAPGRGIELLVEAVRLLRTAIPDVRLRLWLVATTEETRRYLDGLRSGLAEASWATIAEAPYERLGETIGGASILTIPHPAGDYLDVALPVKLFDSLAAGRPLVVTPRRETARVVSAFGVGTVASGDRPEDIATALQGLLADDVRLRAIGARARAVAEAEFDWQIVGDRIAAAVLAREAGTSIASDGPGV